VNYINLDMVPYADIVARVPPLPFVDGAFEEIYAGHLLEHLALEEAIVFLAECNRCLADGGRLAIVVPDTRLIAKRWLENAPDFIQLPEGVWWSINDLDAVCALFLYSTVQDSHHKWSYDKHTLGRRMVMAGFGKLREIDRYRDKRLASPAWFQIGLEGVKLHGKNHSV